MKLRRSKATSRRSSLTDSQILQLATYKAERSRGLVHLPAYDEMMAELQQRFDDDNAADAHPFKVSA